MIYVSWAGYYEGPSDQAYYEVLLPRVMDEIIRTDRTRDVIVPQAPAIRLAGGRSRKAVAEEICRNAEAFHLLFIHADTGGRSIEGSMEARGSAYCQAVRDRCGWHPERCVVLQPRHETEAWVLSDPRAIMIALGLTGQPARYDLPLNAAAAERLSDPKAVLERVDREVRGRRARRDGADLFVRIAQEQSMGALRGSRSFQTFETDLRRALSSLGCL